MGNGNKLRATDRIPPEILDDARLIYLPTRLGSAQGMKLLLSWTHGERFVQGLKVLFAELDFNVEPRDNRELHSSFRDRGDRVCCLVGYANCERNGTTTVPTNVQNRGQVACRRKSPRN